MSIFSKIKNRLRKIKNKFFEKPNHEQIFSDIYKAQIWGTDGKSQFYSGSGSDPAYSKPYISLIHQYIKENNIKSVVDLGCGDFRIGKSIIENLSLKYTGIDVVQDLVDFNNKNFSSANIQFQKRNIVKDKLPDGELCLIRQVLQHLSNKDIQMVLKKLKKFKHVIITEHLPLNHSEVPNLDKVPDGDIRYSRGSGVYLNLPPYNKKVIELLSVEPVEHPESKIVTFKVVV